MNITRKTLSNPVLIVIIFALISITGLFTFSNLEVNLMPNIKEPFLMVMASYENAGPQSVESAFTQVLEEELSSLSNLKKCLQLQKKVIVQSALNTTMEQIWKLRQVKSAIKLKM